MLRTGSRPARACRVRRCACSAIGVVELDRIDNLEALRARFIERGVFIRPLGNVVYLTPAFTIAKDEVGRLTEAIVATVRAL